MQFGTGNENNTSLDSPDVTRSFRSHFFPQNERPFIIILTRSRSLVAVDLFKREYHRRHFHGEKEQRAAAVCVRKRNIIYLNVQVEQFYERTRERKKERETSSLMKFDESWTIFTFPSLASCLRRRLYQKTEETVGGSDSAKLSAMPKNFEIHLRSPECRPITSEFSDASIKDS